MDTERLRSLGRRIALGLVLVAVAAFVIEGASLPHSHRAAEPAFFNHDHDLTSCATFSGAPVPSAPPAISLSIVIAATVPSAAPKPPTAPHGHADSRAPPLA